MSNSFYHGRYCLTKAQREIIEPLLPAPKSTGRPALNSLTVFNAILWILSSGAAWRDLPPQFGNWNSIYHKFRKWCADDVFENILQALVVNTEKYLLVQIDSTFCKVHQYAAGARKKMAIKQSECRAAARPPRFMLLSRKIFNSLGYC